MSKNKTKSLEKRNCKAVRLLWGSSVDQRHEPIHKNGIGGVCSRVSWPRMAKPAWTSCMCKCRGCVPKV